MDKVKELVACCHKLYANGLVSSTGGNVSIRTDKGLAITPTEYALGELTEDDIVEITLDGEVVRGGKPSKEWRIHAWLMRARPEINAVIHAHPPYTTAVSCLFNLNFEDAMPKYTNSYRRKIGRLPAVPFAAPGSIELAEAVVKGMKAGNAVLMQNHGVTVVGADLREAMLVLEQIEDNARLVIFLGDRGKPLE